MIWSANMNLCSVVIFFVLFKAYTLKDPCIFNEPLPRANYRGGKCKYDEDKSVCDRNLGKNWYRAKTTTSDILLQTTPASLFTCGTKFPYWMNGSFPRASDGQVNRTVCQTTGPQSTCSNTVSIMVKNCGSFYVYELPSLQSCPESYCFGENDTCPPLDPCDFYEYEPLKFDSAKGSQCGASDQCGRPNPFTWYNFAGGQDVLVFLNQKNRNCTHAAFTWVQGSAVITNGISNHTLCVQQGNTSCTEVHHVYSKQCQGYTVYKLPDVPTLSTCEKICLDPVGIRKWFTCRMPDKGQGGQSNSTGSENKEREKNYLWTLGLVTGIGIGAVVALVVVYMYIKQSFRAKKVGTSDAEIHKTTGKVGLPEKGHNVYQHT